MSVDVKTINPMDRFIQDAENVIERSENNFLKNIKSNAKIDLQKTNFPTLKTEEWKYTNLKSLLKNDFIHSSQIEEVQISKDEIEKIKNRKYEHYFLLFVNGVLKEEYSDFNELQNKIVVSTIADAVNKDEKLVEKYFSEIAVDKTAFDFINLSNFTDGFFIQIPDNMILNKPIQIVNITGSKGEMTYSPSRNLIIVGKNSEATIIQKYIGYNGGQYFNSISTEIFIGKNGVLNNYKIEIENEDSYHIEKIDVLQSRDSQFNHYNFTFGGKLIRNDINTELDGENIEVTLNGLYLGKGNQHIDNNTFINHAKPNSTSNELYKGILDDRSHGVFSGKILVERDAQFTNAYQNNNTILLSDFANIDTKPQLEIYADDVKCTHGATVGQLDESALFYILSRGIPKEKAKSMLIKAFAESVVAGVKIEPLRDELNKLIFTHLNREKV